uniref:DCG1 protein n=1 Tax=Bionectria ochroleuca TaxID=29856 RepID=A0A8H7N3G7_BIOOC
MRILILNPNSSQDMTRGMLAATDALKLGDSIKISTYTAPNTSPASINDDTDIKASEEAVCQDIANKSLSLDQYDAVLVACFSVHTLVPRLPTLTSAAVTGIFEASILTAQLLLQPYTDQKWGIVTTGKFWEDHLSAGVRSFFGQAPREDAGQGSNFAGVFSTGLTAGDFHRVPQAEVDAKLREATTKLLKSGDVRCVVMGCGGMAGLERVIRSTATELLGEDFARGLYVVDGVRAGVLQLEQLVRSKQVFV